jgi:ethanolamine ammonia-lyase large subunit
VNSAELRRTFVLANAFKEGDLLVGGTRDDPLRADARRALLATSVADIRRTVFADDGVSVAIERGRDRTRDSELNRLTLHDIKDILLGAGGAAWAAAHRHALPSEVIAGIAKVMTNEELSAVAKKVYNPLSATGSRHSPTPRVTIGSPAHFGSRIQPNSPGDDETEILFSILEGLTYGCGDVVLGVNPAADDVDTIVRLETLLERVVRLLNLPTRYCVLSDIVKQQRAITRARVDIGFQSLAGTSAALIGMVGLDAEGILEIARSFEGLYFETGQGSAVTNGTAEGIDMVTLEARAYGVARQVQRETGAWTIVNDVAGFIGPEVFRTAAQLERACLEDSVMAKLHGLTMGLDVCATFHMGIAPSDLRDLTARIVESAAPAYLMAVAGNSDPMLGYLTTSFREHPSLRRRAGRNIASAMAERLATLGVETPALYAAYARAGGDTRTADALEREGRHTIGRLQERGFDLGSVPSTASPDHRIRTIYDNARLALYAHIDSSVLQDALTQWVRVRTRAEDRDDFLTHPPFGERLKDEDVPLVTGMYPTRRPEVQLVVSDGLNANAVNEHLRALLPPALRMLSQSGLHVGDIAVVVQNGRVRAGYHIGQLLDVPVIIHVVGERPGSGLNTLSAYITYGRDERGRSRWSPSLDHSCTSAVCGIHPMGKRPELAAQEMARLAARMVDEKKSGVSLSQL